MLRSTVHLHPRFSVGEVDDRIFGGFVEHLGRSVYRGIYEPESHFADEHGLRSDVIELIRDLGISTIRYPGGNFASGYHWTNGIGPVDKRPTVRDLAWQSLETNEFGTDEFVQFCQ